MPIRIPNDLPAREILLHEGVNVMTEEAASRQDIRPLRIGLLNLMPEKIKTETQFARLIGASPLQVDLHLVRMSNHSPKNTSAEHMISFYESWQDIQHQKFDGFIITGAPIELMPFEDVTYWSELQQIFNWTQTNVHSSLHICWGAQAALYHFHNVQKHTLQSKAFGVFSHQNLVPASPYLRGFADDFAMPVSRWTEVRSAELPRDRNLQILLAAEDVGLCLINDPDHRSLYMFNHIEYDTNTLGDEYRRDIAAGKTIAPPHHYFPNNDPTQKPLNKWRGHAHLLFGNWINEVYQSTPFDVQDIGK
jgi:homoserine O-succinyltransferase/O-acetyltransferase